MPPFYKRKYYKRNYWNYRFRRNKFRRRRPRTTFRRKFRRRRVRKSFYSKNFKRKLKKLKVTQWQPSYIRKCRITGLLLLFEAGQGHFGNNFAAYKDTFTPHNTPGGGGWSLQELTLANLYTQNQYFMNHWSKTNSGMNLCRFLGTRITLYRQPDIDYFFTYYTEESIHAGKYWYPSFHPLKMMMYKNKVTVPSFKTQPHKRKPYKRIFIKPPKLLKSNWYFQQHLSTYPLIRFAATATSLTNFFIGNKSNNTNITLHTLNTRLFQHSAFQYRGDDGYVPKQGTYVYGLKNGVIDIKTEIRKNVIYLGGPYNDEGTTVGPNGWEQYKRNKELWGNIFYHQYFNFIQTSFISTTEPQTLLAKSTINNNIGETAIAKQEPYFQDVRYNPYKDKGTGNIIYWKSVSDITKNNWDLPTDPDNQMSDFPLWLMLWGWEEYTKKLGKLKNLDNDYVLCVRTSYINEKFAPYIFLSDSFIRGQAPWDNEPEYITTFDTQHWYPKWKFQQEAINLILMSGPGTCKTDSQSIQAYLKYDFLFKWGGNQSKLETIADPLNQPITPSPNNQFLSNEIIDPQTSIENLLYKWDIRRDQLTQAAEQRIKELSTDDYPLFTDGIKPPQPTQTSPQKEKTAQEEEKEALLLQLQQLQQYNHQLRIRFEQLKKLTTQQ